MRDRETIDSELRRVAAELRSIRERGGRPSSQQVDALLDERLGHPVEVLSDTAVLDEILADAGLEKHQVAYIGDDLTDVVVMHRVGLAIATANARHEVKQEAHYVTHAAGGSGLEASRK